MAKGKRIRRWLVEGALLLGLVWAVQVWQARHLPTGRAPPLSGRLLDGRSVALDQLRGTPVLVHFWGTWCPVCRLESGAIDSVARHWPVVSVAMTSGDSATLRAWMQARGLRFPVVPDPDGEQAARWGVQAVPASFVVDARGRIHSALVGYHTAVELRARLWWAGFSLR